MRPAMPSAFSPLHVSHNSMLLLFNIILSSNYDNEELSLVVSSEMCLLSTLLTSMFFA